MAVSPLSAAPSKTNEFVVDNIIRAGVKRAFTLPGLGITWSLPAFYERRGELDVFLTRSEQVASVMAQVTGRLTGKPGLFMGQGPWVSTTGSFGIMEALFSGSPMVVLTETSDYDGFGQYGVYQTMTGDYGGADIQQSLKAITKYCTYATEPEAAVYGFQMAYKHASTPRMGPAAVIMKSTIIKQDMPASPKARLYPPEGYWTYSPAKPDPEALARLARMLGEASQPVIVSGQGVYDARIGADLQALAEKLGVAVVTSYNGKGTVDELSPVACGMLGTWGNRTANRMLSKADLVLILGASMGPDYTRFRDPDMVRPGDQKIVQVDIDPRNAGWVYPVDLAIEGDVKDVVAYLQAQNLASDKKEARQALIEQVREETGYNDPPRLEAAPGSLHHTDVVAAMQNFLGPDDVVTLDAGSNRIWNTNSLRIRHPNHILVPGGVGGMGWGGPAAAAAKLALPQKRVTCLAGDGGFLMTIDVVATCVQHNVPVVFVVSNNSGLGMVRDNMGPKKIAVDFGEVNFAKTAEGLGAAGMRVDSFSGLEDALREAHKLDGPVVVEVKVDPAASYTPAAHGGAL
ncbi:MAG: thiamine pyrophosphate-binding protein [Desulfarculaceae bacterium]|nr:thiamine pyrophosphate-binding protein [Desulfarculaceae bacterium]MCF8071961.1 thiamine pyrophosphate-binding protein [Desulfarculaceae bacterium]MCF8101478.1 thiamine pyrophosphate-binding protein [Desulfarculaceae bacterium]MCF8115028.1 thiamine pyrophosphate-binding protein [Desulfarculaceae bacterium]